MGQASDSYSRSIQKQIANAKEQLQQLSANKDMTMEEKMKKRQEIQKQINELNNQLRQHQRTFTGRYAGNDFSRCIHEAGKGAGERVREDGRPCRSFKG